MEGAFRFGSLLHARAVRASNVVRDVQEQLRNLLGGRMNRYEVLVAETTELAFENFRLLLAKHGWEGAVAVRLSAPTVVEGGCVIVIYGTPFKVQRDPGA